MAGLYLHIRKDKNEPFYVGIFEKESRPYEVRRNSIWEKIVNKTEFEVLIVEQNLTWEEACEKEKILIKKYGRIDLGTGILSNMTDGGDGTVGLIRTEEHQSKITQKLRGRKVSEETKRLLSQKSKEWARKNGGGSTKGRKLSEQHKLKMSLAKKGKPANPNSIEGMRKSRLGTKLSQEHKLKLSESAKKRPPMSQETKDKISKSVTAVQTGRPCKEETKLKISKTLMGHKNSPSIPCSPEKAKKISEAQKGKKLSYEHKKKLSEAAKKRIRKPLSEETKRKIGEANRKKHTFTL